MSTGSAARGRRRTRSARPPGPPETRSRAPACAVGRGRRAWLRMRSRSRRRRSRAAVAVRSSAAASVAARRADRSPATRPRWTCAPGPGAGGRGALALGDRAACGGAQLAQVLVQPCAMAGDVVRRVRGTCERARGRGRAPLGARGARAGRRCRRGRRGPPGNRRARPSRPRGWAWSRRRRRRRRAACGRCGGRRRRSPGRAAARPCGTGSRRRTRTGRRASPPPRATTITSTSGDAARSWSARVTAGAAWRSCTGAKPHTSRPRPAAPASPATTSSRALPDSPGDDADAARQRRARQRLLGLEQALGVQAAPQLLQLGQEVALAGDAQPRDREREPGRGGPGARVEVAAAGGHDLRAVGERAQLELVEVLAPHRARQRARGVTQLEPHLRAPRLEPEHLAEDLHAREAAQAVAQRGRVLTDRVRAGEDRAGDAVGGVHALRTLAGGQDGYAAPWTSRMSWGVSRRNGGHRGVGAVSRGETIIGVEGVYYLCPAVCDKTMHPHRRANSNGRSWRFASNVVECDRAAVPPPRCPPLRLSHAPRMIREVHGAR